MVEEKYLRVANYVRNMNKEIDMIAHSCGLRHAREFRREHVRIVRSANESVALNMLYPYPETRRAPAAIGAEATGKPGYSVERALDADGAAYLPDRIAAGAIVRILVLEALRYRGCDHGFGPVARQAQRLDRDRFHVAEVAPLRFGNGFRELQAFGGLTGAGAAIEIGQYRLLPGIRRAEQRIARLQADARNPGAGLP